MKTFDEWMADKLPPKHMTLNQYSNYALGWRNSMPWAYKGMSIAYDAWAEKNWPMVQSVEHLKKGWEYGLALKGHALRSQHDKRWLHASVEEAADFGLTIDETLMALAELAVKHAENIRKDNQS